MLPILLLACDNPISNAVFLADEDFLAALPGPRRLAFPARLRTLAAGDEPMLGFAGEAAGGLVDVAGDMIVVGEVFRSTQPAERTPTSRRFGARPITLPDGPTTWWMRADLARSADAAPITWTIEGAPAEDGPWSVVAAGRHAPDGVGAFSWDTPVIAALAGADDPTPAAEVDYVDRNEDDQREVGFTFAYAFGLPVTFAYVGEVAFGFTGAFDYAGTGDPADEVPTWATVIADIDGSGRADGVVLLDGLDQPFTSCWNTDGDRVYAEGPTIVGPLLGDETACPTFE